MKLCGLILCWCAYTGRFTIASAYFMNDMVLRWLCMMLTVPVIISVDELTDEILFSSSKGCSMYKKILSQIEMSYLLPCMVDVQDLHLLH